MKLTAAEQDELVRCLMDQGWHARPALMMSESKDAPAKLAMFRLMAASSK